MEEEEHNKIRKKPPATIYYTAHNKKYINFNKALKSSFPSLLYIYGIRRVYSKLSNSLYFVSVLLNRLCHARCLLSLLASSKLYIIWKTNNRYFYRVVQN